MTRHNRWHPPVQGEWVCHMMTRLRKAEHTLALVCRGWNCLVSGEDRIPQVSSAGITSLSFYPFLSSLSFCFSLSLSLLICGGVLPKVLVTSPSASRCHGHCTAQVPHVCMQWHRALFQGLEHRFISAPAKKAPPSMSRLQFRMRESKMKHVMDARRQLITMQVRHE